MKAVKLASFLAALAFSPSLASATPILLSDLAGFTVLGGSTVTNVPTSTINGSVGVWSSGGANAITGFNSAPGVPTSDPQVTNGFVDAGTSTGLTDNAMLAQSQLTLAIAGLGAMGPGTSEPADLVGLILAPGVYSVPAGTTNLSGTVTLDGQGNANASWVFLFASTLITSSNSVVDVINAGAGASLFWDVGSSATLGTDSTFLGNILALTSITLDTNATDACGRVLAENGAVTLQENTLSNDCSGITGASADVAGSGGLNGGTGQVVTAVPEPSSLLLLLTGLVGLMAVKRGRNARAAG